MQGNACPGLPLQIQVEPQLQSRYAGASENKTSEVQIIDILLCDLDAKDLD